MPVRGSTATSISPAGLRIDGVVKGNVVADDNGTVVLSEHATVEGEIRVAHAVINGKVIGPIHGAECVELQAKANVTGDVNYKIARGPARRDRAGPAGPRGRAREDDKVVSFKPGAGD